MKAMLIDLITPEERDRINKTTVSIIKHIELLTVKELSDISLILIKPKKDGKLPRCILSAKAIQILINRAIKKHIQIF